MSLLNKIIRLSIEISNLLHSFEDKYNAEPVESARKRCIHKTAASSSLWSIFPSDFIQLISSRS